MKTRKIQKKTKVMMMKRRDRVWVELLQRNEFTIDGLKDDTQVSRSTVRRVVNVASEEGVVEEVEGEGRFSPAQYRVAV